MPKSKKPRHAHRRKFTYSTIWLPEEQITAIKNLFLHAEMVAEIKLVRGMCTYDDVACMRDTMNFALGAQSICTTSQRRSMRIGSKIATQNFSKRKTHSTLTTSVALKPAQSKTPTTAL